MTNYLNRIKKGIAVIAMIAAGYLGIGCNEDGSGASPDRTPPAITSAASIADQFEGDIAVDAEVSDASGLSSVTVQYREKGSASVWDEIAMSKTGFNNWSGLGSIQSQAIEYRTVAIDNYSNKTIGTQNTAVLWSNEANGDAELQARLQFYKDSADILDFWIDYSFDFDGKIVEVDAAVLPSIPEGFNGGWYQGKADTDHASEKSQMESYLTLWWQINSCLRSEIAGKLDEIKNAGWAGGQIKNSKSLGLDTVVADCQKMTENCIDYTVFYNADGQPVSRISDSSEDFYDARGSIYKTDSFDETGIVVKTIYRGLKAGSYDLEVNHTERLIQILNNSF